jgi:hypothetical protein
MYIITQQRSQQPSSGPQLYCGAAEVLGDSVSGNGKVATWAELAQVHLIPNLICLFSPLNQVLLSLGLTDLPAFDDETDSSYPLAPPTTGSKPTTSLQVVVVGGLY